MIGPPWLAAIFGALVFIGAMVALVRLVVAWRTRRATDREIDIHNTLMGVSMAGMLIPSLRIVTSGPSTTSWLIVWILTTIWFAVSVIRNTGPNDVRQQLARHHFAHLVMSGAMVYMLAVTGSAAAGPLSGGDMSGMGSGGLAFPTLDYAFVIFMVGYAVLVIDRLPQVAVVSSARTIEDSRLAASPVPVPVPVRVPVAPRLAEVTNIVMAIAMGYMLTMMFV
ncbi:MAG: hypothetical protein JWQ47_952 [Glaciihabitans sp.]|nr:hypothetical protein [Glaciihabitans sp.]